MLSRQTLWRAEDIMQAAPSELPRGADDRPRCQTIRPCCAATAADAVRALFRQFTGWQARATGIASQ